MAHEDLKQENSFDFGKTSSDYARYRDIYPQEFYEKILERNIGTSGQRILDLGTGTGVLPRNLYQNGAKWIGSDISKEQIAQAIQLSKGLPISYYVSSTEELSFPENSFDAITMAQCYWYFDPKQIVPKLQDWLKPDGSVLVLYMAWLPFEDEIAGQSEELVLKYNPKWTGKGETIKPIVLPKEYFDAFDLVYHEEFITDIPFTRESWHGRMKACRGTGASLSSDELSSWEKEHIALLDKIAPPEFTIKHYIALAELKPKKGSEIMAVFDRSVILDINEGLEVYNNTPDALLIDVRREDEYKTGHIEGSINVPLADIEDVTDIADDIETPIVLYCKTGNRAIQAMTELKEIGYDNVVSIGGINKYKGELVE